MARPDYRRVPLLDVYADAALVGHLRREGRGCRFDYTPEFLLSGRRPVALHLPKDEGGVQAEGMLNLPTYFSGLLPEGIMGEAVARLLRTSEDDVFTILAATGYDAVGDVTVEVPGAESPPRPKSISDAKQELDQLLSGVEVEPPCAIGGAQPKMSVGDLSASARQPTRIVKFESPRFPGIVQNEAFVMSLAREAGLPAAKVAVKEGALVVQRFDRRAGPTGIEKVHVEDALQLMDLHPLSKYLLEYREIVDYVQGLGFPTTTILGMIRLYVFSYVVGNGDLHAKNVSFLYDDTSQTWSLAPAYDLLTTLPYAAAMAGADRMALALADEAFGEFTADGFCEFGRGFGVAPAAVRAVIDRICRAVAKALADPPPFFQRPVVLEMLGRADTLRR